MNEDTTVCREVRHGTEEYRQTVALREEILRRPLDLSFSPEELAEEKDSFHLACWQDGILAACLVLKPQPGHQVRMRQLAVAKACQGKGFGKRLVDYSESFALQHGYREIVMHARETAVGFYQRLGYSKEGDRFIEVTIPHFAMRKTLGEDGELVHRGAC